MNCESIADASSPHNQYLRDMKSALLVFIVILLLLDAAAPLSTLTPIPAQRVVVVGGGWAGYSTAAALSTSSDPVDVKILEASPRVAGGLR